MNRDKLLKLVRQSGISYKEPVGDEMRVCCPKCPKGDTRYKFYFNLKKEQGHCFRCDARVGTSEKFLVYICGISPTKIVGNAPGIQPASYLQKLLRKTRDCEKVEAPLPEKSWVVSERTDLVSVKEIWLYLKRRGFTWKTVAKVIKPVVSFSYHNWFILPVYSGEELRFWIRRTILGHVEPKYLSFDYKTDGDGDQSKYYSKSEVIWGYDLIKEGEPVVICEGILSAAAVVQCGFSAVAILGSTLSKKQRVLLREKNPSCVIVLLDGPRPGDNTRKKTHKILRMLDDYFDVKIPELPVGKDPNDLLDRLVLKSYISQYYG
ncbi:toprim domain-containing protein [Patescibacteria group bacterium]|nr:toprim domain-containing protein [Patescibacteria group bacterium]